MSNYLIIGVIIVALFGGSASAGLLSSLNPFSKNKSVNTVPMKESKDKRSIRCKGESVVNDEGQVISCSEGFYLEQSSENLEERKQNWKERFINFQRRLSLKMFILFAGLVLLFPSSIGFIFGRILEATRGVAQKALKVSVKAISRAKRNGGKYLEELERAHSADPKVKKKINALRAETDAK